MLFLIERKSTYNNSDKARLALEYGFDLSMIAKLETLNLTPVFDFKNFYKNLKYHPNLKSFNQDDMNVVYEYLIQTYKESGFHFYLLKDSILDIFFKKKQTVSKKLINFDDWLKQIITDILDPIDSYKVIHGDPIKKTAIYINASIIRSEIYRDLDAYVYALHRLAGYPV
jgi:hypothetical protein